MTLENRRRRKNLDRKSLIPLPPTGSASLFCAKPGGGANHAPAQARCGVCRAFSDYKVCQGFVKRCSGIAQGYAAGELGWVGMRPVYKGVSYEKLRKVGFSFLMSFAPGAHNSLVSLLSKQL
ncbi:MULTISPECIES: hypothetical protein [Pseudomonas]|uniref:hypothetical protein n=1 Tax=Pseudomonas TaxID=286 RepID=UPI00234E075D|nr:MULTISPECIES: hypothetical protein [Pseudomonas]MDC7817552.1 hypothetical protein [Pseudomonas sp. BLCC-B112]MDP9518559.1 hypothetical protein [Pseudomonas protegens]